MDVKKVILSRSRYESINTHKILTNFDLVVPESEYPMYEAVVDNADAIVKIPDNVEGLGAVRNWVLDYYDEECIVMFDDDISHFFSLLNIRAYKITDKQMIDTIVLNCASNCKDANLSTFGFNQQGADVRKYDHTKPFNLKTWSGTIMGIIGRKYRFTEINKTKVDADFSLQCLLRDRIVWLDSRFSFQCKRDNNKGGNSLYRDQASVDREIRFLEEKWGKYIKIKKHDNVYSLKLNVERNQKTAL